MREDWNKGYEKGRDDYCCNHNCNQGRDCPLRKKELTDKEITEIYFDDPDILVFARAILRKAQEADKIESLGTVNIGGVHFRNGKEVK